jgi:hypothetical protein
MRDPRSENGSTRKSETVKLERESVKEKAWKRSKPRTTNSLKKGHKCRIRNHEGKRAPERKGKGRLECRQRKHGRDMYEAAGLRDERLGFSNHFRTDIGSLIWIRRSYELRLGDCWILVKQREDVWYGGMAHPRVRRDSLHDMSKCGGNAALHDISIPIDAIPSLDCLRRSSLRCT